MESILTVVCIVAFVAWAFKSGKRAGSKAALESAGVVDVGAYAADVDARR